MRVRGVPHGQGLKEWACVAHGCMQPNSGMQLAALRAAADTQR